MKQWHRILCLCVLGIATLSKSGYTQANSQNAPAPRPQAITLFEMRVRPLLIQKCFSCHSENSRPVQGGLRLDSREGLLKGGESGAALVPGNPEESRLIRAVTHTDAVLKMPPTGKLTQAEIAALTAWVKVGAPWPKPLPPRNPNNTAKKSSLKPTFWAFLPPKSLGLPQVKNKTWVNNPIDSIILAGLEKKGLTPAPPTDRRTLIRRATLDLTGLPPTPQEVQEFLADQKPGAFARVVDRLLASSAYGERWGRHWLDAARYADSNGVDENLVYTQAWRYRDYVVRAFNQDKPFDRFIQEQIAGDLLPALPNEEAEFDRVLATGYLSLGPKMLAEDDPVKQELDIIDEQVDTLGKTFLGMTLGCARCHDHKFDPISIADYYSLAGIFKSTKTMKNFRNMAEWQEVPIGTNAEKALLKQSETDIADKKKEVEKRHKLAGEALLAKVQNSTDNYLRVAQEILRNEKATHTLQPIIAKPEEPLPPGAILVEAEDFLQGNVLKDRDGFGKGIGVLVNAGKYPNVTEYEVSITKAGAYQMDIRYASNDPRPIRLYINDALVSAQATGKITGGFDPESQKWLAEGVFALKAGKNRIKFERDNYFPHIDKFLLTERNGQPLSFTPEQAAQEAGLIPEFVSQAIEQIRNSPADQPLKLNFALPPSAERFYTAEIRSEIQSLNKEIQTLEKKKPTLSRAMAVTEGMPTTLKVHLRGNYLTLGSETRRRFPTILAGDTQKPLPENTSGRLELSQWLTEPNNPLTSRVLVNRVWRWHFGKGIVGSTDNFGILGDRPTNQLLLDWLAKTFIADKWSLKQLHRRIMLSNTYQMSTKYNAKAAQVDPENKLHWRNERKRLEAEAIRDSILAVSGKLDRTIGGTLLKMRDREYVTSTANSDPINYRSNRRSLYLPVIRSALYDVYTAFDFGDPTVMNGDRSSTTVAPQALFMMNSPLVLEHTKAFAEKLLAQSDLTDAQRIRSAYETCYARPATNSEVTQALTYLQRLEQAYSSTEQDLAKRRVLAYQSLCKSLIGASEFIYVD